MAGAPPASLRSTLSSGRFVTAPGVYDLITARIADPMGFDALYMTGYGVSAAQLGVPDAGLVTYTDMVERVRVICERTTTPLIADADTGYGGLVNVRHTVRGYERAGAQGIQIEDQEMPKKCGHTPGRKVIAADEMVLKIRVAVDSREREDTLIIARTDARTELGLDEALRRAEAYAAAGADVLFIEAAESEEELARIGAALDVPLLVNVVQFGRTPILPAARLAELGFSIAIYPVLALAAVAEAVRRTYEHLRSAGSALGLGVPLYDTETSGQSLHELVGFPEIWAFEQHWRPPV